jgi:hypothetical protein
MNVEYYLICILSYQPIPLDLISFDARSQYADVSGGYSLLTACSPENSGIMEGRFADEPLYQFYAVGIVEVSHSRCEVCAT